MTAPLPARLLLVDDHRLFNDGLRKLLDEQPDLMVCGQVFKAADVLPAVQRTQPDVVLLDVNLQGTNGIELGRQLLTHYPHLRVLMLTMYSQPKLADEARREGLHGYLLKDSTTPDLLRSIRAVRLGGTAFEPFAAPLFAPPTDSFADDFAQRLNLTFREVEIVRLIREGLSNEQIADRLTLSVETVKTHRKNIHFKLGINKVTDLVQFAVRHGL